VFNVVAKLGPAEVQRVVVEVDDLLERRDNGITKLELDAITLDVNSMFFSLFIYYKQTTVSLCEKSAIKFTFCDLFLFCSDDSSAQQAFDEVSGFTWYHYEIINNCFVNNSRLNIYLPFWTKTALPYFKPLKVVVNNTHNNQLPYNPHIFCQRPVHGF
jgi:hypothetical protein